MAGISLVFIWIAVVLFAISFLMGLLEKDTGPFNLIALGLGFFAAAFALA